MIQNNSKGPHMGKDAIEQEVEEMLTSQNFTIAGRDFERPWGGFFLIAKEQTSKFIDTFFPELVDELREQHGQLSPKILVVSPGLRLSWQYHDRRAELHKVLKGSVAYPFSQTDEQPEPVVYHEGALIRIPQGTRHRLIGLEDWGIVAEIWQHTDPDHLSDEDDNHRVQDDFKRV